MGKQWFLEESGQISGPFSSSILKTLAVCGIVAPESMIALDNPDKWYRADRVQGLLFGKTQHFDGVAQNDPQQGNAGETIAGLIDELNSEKAARDLLQDTLANQESRLQKLSAQRNEFLARLTFLEASNEELKLKLERLERENQANRSEKAHAELQAAERVKELGVLSDSLLATKSSCDLMRERAESLEQQLRLVGEERARLVSEHKTKTDKLERSLLEATDSVRDRDNVIYGLQQKVADSEASHRSNETEITRLRAAQTDYQVRVDALQSESKVLNSELESKKSALSKAIEVCRQEAEQSRSLVKQLDSLKSQVTDVKTNHQADLNRLSAESEDLRAQIDRLKVEVQTLDRDNRELWSWHDQLARDAQAAPVDASTNNVVESSSKLWDQTISREASEKAPSTNDSPAVLPQFEPAPEQPKNITCKESPLEAEIVRNDLKIETSRDVIQDKCFFDEQLESIETPSSEPCKSECDLHLVEDPETTTSETMERRLARAYEENAFGIAGLADIEINADLVQRSYAKVRSVVFAESSPRSADRESLALVMFSLIEVARNHFAEEGWNKYWDYLFVELDRRQDRQLIRRDQKAQELLGEWFREALRRFHYSIPEHSQKYLRPILFHAGIPAASIKGTLEVIADSCKRYRSETEHLPFDLREDCVIDKPQLHKSVRELFSNKLLGAAELWRSLARVVYAKVYRGNCELELSELPSVISRQHIEAFFEREHIKGISRSSHLAMARLVYSVEDGAVRIILPPYSRTRYLVKSGDSEIDGVFWNSTAKADVAELRFPLPPLLKVASECKGEEGELTIQSHPKQKGFEFFNSIWFHAKNGRIEDGRIIEANGVSGGHWYMLIDGTPDFTGCAFPTPPVQKPLVWSWSEQGKTWTAWKLQVPERTLDSGSIHFMVDGRPVELPLGLRPGFRISLEPQPLSIALTASGESIAVYDKPPSVRLERDRVVEVNLLKLTGLSLKTIRAFSLSPQIAIDLKQCKLGRFQLREKRGRILCDFAVIPQWSLCKPEYSPDGKYVSLQVAFDSNLGSLEYESASHVLEPIAGLITVSTIEPYLRLLWRWRIDPNEASEQDEDEATANELVFPIPIVGVRWRVRGVEGVSDSWTRETVFLQRDGIAIGQSVVEIQFPSGSEFYYNNRPYEGRKQLGPCGETVVFQLASVGDCLEVSIESSPFLVVMRSDHPTVESETVELAEGSLAFSCKVIQSVKAISVVVKDPFDFGSNERAYPLQLGSDGRWQGKVAVQDLPDTESLGITFIKINNVGFFKQSVKRFSNRSDGSAYGILVDSASGNFSHVSVNDGSWPMLLFREWLEGKRDFPFDERKIVGQVQRCFENGKVSTDELVAAVEQINAVLLERHADTNQGSDRLYGLRSAVLTHINRSYQENKGAWLTSDSPSGFNERLKALLNLGIEFRESFRDLLDEAREHHQVAPAYPIQYIEDLDLISQHYSQIDEYKNSNLDMEKTKIARQHLGLQNAALERVLRFYDDHKLPSLQHFVPIQRDVGELFLCENHAHAISLSLARIRENSKTRKLDFEERLGFDKRFSFDAEPTSADHKFGIKHLKYSLSWDLDSASWIFEFAKSAMRCCSSQGHPLIVKPWSGADLAHAMNLFKVLKEWSEPYRHEAIDESCIPQAFETIFKEPKVAPLHRIVLQRTEVVVQPLFGTLIKQKLGSELPDISKVAWKSAWIEIWRHHTGGNISPGAIAFESSALRTFNMHFIDITTRWPRLMGQCLALAEIVYRTLVEDGIGVAVKFGDKSTSSKYQYCQGIALERQNCTNEVQHFLGTVVDYDCHNATVLVRLENSRRTIPFHWELLSGEQRITVNRTAREKALTVAQQLRNCRVMCTFSKQDPSKVIGARLID